MNNATGKNLTLNLASDTKDPEPAFLTLLSGADVESSPAGLAQPVLEESQGENEDWRRFGFLGNDFGQVNFGTTAEQNSIFSTPNLDPVEL